MGRAGPRPRRVVVASPSLGTVRDGRVRRETRAVHGDGGRRRRLGRGHGMHGVAERLPGRFVRRFASGTGGGRCGGGGDRVCGAGGRRRRRVVVARGATEGERVQAARGSRQRVRGRVMNGGVVVASALWNESRVYTKRCKRCRRRRRCRVVIIYVQRSPFLISVSPPPECHPRTCSPRPPAPARTPPPRRRRLAGPGEGSAATAGAGAAARRT